VSVVLWGTKDYELPCDIGGKVKLNKGEKRDLKKRQQKSQEGNTVGLDTMPA